MSDYRVWEEICKHLTPLQRVRIRRKVANEGWTLRKAIEAEGVMWVAADINPRFKKEQLEAAEGWLRGI